MKKASAVILCMLCVIALLSACAKRNNDYANYLITLPCESGDYWEKELEREGIVAVTESEDIKSDGTVSYLYLLEAIGEGETKIEFSRFDTETGGLKETTLYAVKVDSDYKITAQVLSDTLIEQENTVTHIENKDDAQAAVEAALVEENSDYEGKLFFKTKEKDGVFTVNVYVMAKNKKGNSFLKYLMTYKLDPDANMQHYFDDSVKNRPYTDK